MLSNRGLMANSRQQPLEHRMLLTATFCLLAGGGVKGGRVVGATNSRGEAPIERPAAAEVTAVEPTGVGDAFRAGFLAALAWGLSLEHAAEVGCVLAAYVVETVGPQEYAFTSAEFVDRLRMSYGDEAADEVAKNLN
jgi:adenosine kinase